MRKRRRTQVRKGLTFCRDCGGRGTIACRSCEGKGVVPALGELRASRLRVGVTLRAFARGLGLSAAYISDVELGRRRATPRVLAGYRAVGLR